MFLYLFLVAAAITSSETSTPIEPELQEIITLLTSSSTEASKDAQEENIAPTSLASAPALESTPEATVTEQSSIIITNAIQPTMLAYKHWTGTYNPDKFTITVNGTEIAQGAQHTLPATKDPIEIRYDYSFVNGKRTGAQVVSYQLNENITQANITFSWNDDWKVLVDHGKAVKQQAISHT